jgi:penicillin-binding protein 1A
LLLYSYGGQWSLVMGIFGGGKKAKGKGKAPARGRREPRLYKDEPEEDLRAPARRALPKKRRRGFFRWLFSLFLALAFWGTVAGALAFGVLWYSLQSGGLFKIPEREPGIMVLADDGSEIAEQGTFFGDAVDIKELPDYVPNAIIAIEDRRFYSHFGIDPIGLSRAMARNVLAGHMREGGSTLTQQLAKNLFLTQERTFSRKAQEAVFALWLESKFSKDEILQLYLNRIYFGGGANGIDKAARSFYGKSAYELSLMEAATLAALLKAPTTYNPVNNPEEARTRAKLVLDAMLDQGYITADDEKIALTTDSKAATTATALNATQYAVDWVNSQLPLFVKDRSKSLIIETTLDPTIQANAEDSLRRVLAANGKKLNVGQGAVVTLDRNGAIRALVGGRSYQKSQFNRATVAKRQPGSAFKAFVYLAAMENGYQPQSVEVDEPVTVGGWSPENYKHKYLGEVNLQQAYAMSLNTVAVKLTAALTPTAVTDVAKRLGIVSKLGNDASIALGTSEVSVLEMATAFTPFGNGGQSVEPYIVKRVLTRDGKVIYQRSGDGLPQVIDDHALGEMNAMMREVINTGTAKRAKFTGMDMGGKTGTSQDYRDAWFVGYTPYYTTAVWMGNDDNTPTKQVTGGSLPALVWHDVMMAAHQGLEARVLPGTIPTVTEPETQVANVDVQSSEPAPQVVDPPQQEVILQPAPRAHKKRGLLAKIFGIGDDSGSAPRQKKVWELRQEGGGN